jgi:imidazolonepropionase-like amidohydrolase
MRAKWRVALVLVSLVVCCGGTLASAGPVRKKLAIQAGRIITMAGPDIQDGLILVEDGIIKTVGQSAEIPWDAEVIEAKDKVIMPGFVLAHTSDGLDAPNERVPEVPFLSTFDSIDPIAPFFEDSLRDGVVAMLVLPGNRTLLGGTGTVVKPCGKTVEAMLIKRYTGLKISLQPPVQRTMRLEAGTWAWRTTVTTNRMGHMQHFRRYMAELKEYREQYELRKKDAQEQGKPFDEEIDLRRQPMIDLSDRKLTAFIYCDKAADVANAIEIRETYDLNAVLVLGPECYKAVDLIRSKKLPIILDPNLIVWETNEQTHAEEMKVVPQIFHKAGVKFAFQTDTSQYGRRYLWHQAALAVRYGMDRVEALKSITLYPAQFIGIDDRFGSIESGKDASLLFLTGDPLEVQTWVDRVMISGEIVYDKAKDVRLKKVLERPKDLLPKSAELNTD